MIRINLLAAERPAAKKKAAGAPGAFQAYLMMGLFAGVTLLACASAWWYMTAQLKELDDKIAAGKKRQAELQAIKVQVDQFLLKKRILDAKVKLIEQLKAQQSGPVHMLDEISKAMPDFVWLTSLDQTGNTMRFTGESNGLTSVADLITNLQKSGWFKQVDLVSSQEQNNVVQFQLQAEFQPPPPPPTADMPAATPASGKPAAPAAPAAKP
jgi:type IV pilus assembly protein PilN